MLQDSTNIKIFNPFTDLPAFSAEMDKINPGITAVSPAFQGVVALAGVFFVCAFLYLTSAIYNFIFTLVSLFKNPTKRRELLSHPEKFVTASYLTPSSVFYAFVTLLLGMALIFFGVFTTRVLGALPSILALIAAFLSVLQAIVEKVLATVDEFTSTIANLPTGTQIQQVFSLIGQVQDQITSLANNVTTINGLPTK